MTTPTAFAARLLPNGAGVAGDEFPNVQDRRVGHGWIRRYDHLPIACYRDARTAIDWLGEAYGCTEREVHADENGTIRHAERHVPGGGIVMLGTEPDGDDPRFGEHAGTSWLYISTTDPDGHHDRAVAAGAEIVRALEDTDYGSR